MAQMQQVVVEPHGTLWVDRANCPACVSAHRFSSRMKNGTCTEKTCPLYRITASAMQWAQEMGAVAGLAYQLKAAATMNTPVQWDLSPALTNRIAKVESEAPATLGLSLLSTNAELALQDLEAAAARVCGYLKRIKEKL